MTSVMNWFYQNGDIITVLKKSENWRMAVGGGGVVPPSCNYRGCMFCSLSDTFLKRGIKVENEK